tara:strand:- start:1871 stop:2584 length:714 start_codon:yes stop_codon:yes gene_type:complete
MGNFVGKDQLTVSTSSVGFTSDNIPSQAISALVYVETASVRFGDATNVPTSTDGPIFQPGDTIPIMGSANIVNARFIRDGSTDATLSTRFFSGFDIPFVSSGARRDDDGRLLVVAAQPGASEVKSLHDRSGSTSTDPETILTPTSGKKVRIVGISLYSKSATAAFAEVYFGTGANYNTNANKQIMSVGLDLVDLPSIVMVWPDGAGPVGLADDIVVIGTQGADITNSLGITMQYREE